MKNRRSYSPAFIAFLLAFNFFPLMNGYPSESASLTPEEGFENALALYKKKDYAQALETFQSLEEKFPSNPLRPDWLFMQGQALRALEKWPEAAQIFSRAAEIHTALGDYALYYQGEALQMAGEGVKSSEVFKCLVTSHLKSLLVPLAKLKTAEIYLQLGEYLQTAEVCEGLQREGLKKEYSAQALYFLGQAREGLGQWPEAVKAYQELWLKYPLHPLAKQARARWDFLMKEKKLSEEKIPPESLFRRSLLLYQALLFEAASEEMERIEGFPSHSYPDRYAGESWVDDLYFHRGMCFFRLKKYGQAAELFILIVQNSRNEEMAEKALFFVIRSLFRMDRNEEALHNFRLLQGAYPRGAFMDQALYLRARIFEEKEDLPQAISFYREIAENFPQSPLRFPAMWQCGWLLFKSNDLPGAIQAWNRLQASSPNSSWVEKVLYWKGRSLERLEKTQEAEENYQQLRKNYPASYYTQLVANRGRSLKSRRIIPDSLQAPILPPFFKLETHPDEPVHYHFEKGILLARLGLISMAVDELEAAEGNGKSFDEMRLEISRLYREVGEYHRSALLVRKNIKLRPFTGRLLESEKNLFLLAYPLGNPSWINPYAKKHKLDAAFLSAVILEESRFNPQAVSPAGARGLMQVLPSTANQIVQRIKVRPYSESLLFDPEMNLRLGSWYLSSLLEEFGGKETLALAAYNAGPHMVRQWIAKTPAMREDEFVENIPYAETRNYVIRVLSSAQVYRMLYGSPKKSAEPAEVP